MSVPVSFTPANIDFGSSPYPFREVVIQGAPSDANVTAAIIAGTAFFKVRNIIVYDIRYEPADPSLLLHGFKPGPRGWPQVPVYEQILQSDGSAVAVLKGQVVSVSVEGSIPNGPVGSDELTGKLLIQGEMWDPIIVPLSRTISHSYWITGMEIVQAVQTPNNEVPLIGFKTTFVRVFVQSSRNRNDITGRLFVPSAEGSTRQLLPIVSNQELTIAVSPTGSDRTKWEGSLNFKLDDDLTAPGTRDIQARIYSASEGLTAIPPTEHTMSMTAKFSKRIDLHVFGVVWAAKNHDDDPYNYTGPAAPWSDFEGHRRFVENVFPVSTFTIDPLPGVGPQPPNPQTFNNLTESRSWA
jgi:hypothetical protein